MRLRKNEMVLVSVLASFVPGKPPVPIKVILKDSLCDQLIFNVDKRHGVYNQIFHVTYKCETFFDDYSKRYLLLYSKKEMEWTLKNLDFFTKRLALELP